MASAVGRKPFSLSSVAFTNTITRIVCLLVCGLASERRTGAPEIDIVLRISFYLWGDQDRAAHATQVRFPP
jgi:hypothetical protein